MNVQNEVILLLGKTGAGKSTLGNQLLGSRDNKPFIASDSKKSKTSRCEVATLTINGKKYDLVDTPGLFDNQGVDPLKEIAEFVHQCAGGVRAILLVIAGRITPEEENTLGSIRKFLGVDATNHFIVVFSKADRQRVKDKKIDWGEIKILRDFIEQIGRRWCVSPVHPDFFDVDRQINEERLMEIKNFISNIPETYTTKQFIKNQELQKRLKEEAEEAERKKKADYEKYLIENAVEGYKVKQDELIAKQDQLIAKQKQLEDDLEYEQNRNRYQNSYRNKRKIVTTKVCGLTQPVIKVEPPKYDIPRVVYVDSNNSREVKNEGSKEVKNEGSKEVKNEDPGILGKAIIGAALGTVVEPGLGTIAGGIVGLVKGVVDEITK